MVDQYIEIANIMLCVSSPRGLLGSGGNVYSDFVHEKADCKWHIIFEPVGRLPYMPEKKSYESDEYDICQREDGSFVRCFKDRKEDGMPYAVTVAEQDIHQVKIYYLREKQKYISEWGNAFFHIGWVKILEQEEKFVLHASCIETPFGGILFSGISGIGKSTQADLWCHCTDSRLLNGDRPIIGREDDIWTAYGSPYAGSSKCYRNDSCPIGAIVMLQQAPECTIRKLKMGEAFRRIYAGTTINSWDPGYVDRICTLETELVSEIPVYELSCTPDERAVKLLWDTLKGGM